MIRALLQSVACAVAFVLFAPGVPFAAPPEPGLIASHTALPRSFPLLVQSPAGQDALLRLMDPDTGALVLSAFVKGGAFFRVLVPPGRFEVRLDLGATWQDDATLFGPDTRHLVIGPLDFALAGDARKQGHRIVLGDLAAGGGVAVRGLSLCQRREVARLPHAAPPSGVGPADPVAGHLPPLASADPAPPGPPPLPAPGSLLRIRVCD